jgi:transposase
MLMSMSLEVAVALARAGAQLGINGDTLRGWVNQYEVNQGGRVGVKTSDAQKIRKLERENRELRRANSILKTASAFFAAELDRPQPK